MLYWEIHLELQIQNNLATLFIILTHSKIYLLNVSKYRDNVFTFRHINII